MQNFRIIGKQKSDGQNKLRRFLVTTGFFRSDTECGEEIFSWIA